MARTVRSLMDMLTSLLSEQEDDLSGAEEFCRFYAETKNYLVRYAEQTMSTFIAQKTASLPAIQPAEFRKGNDFGIFGLLLSTRLRAFRVNEKLEMKLRQIRNDLTAILAVIESPELENMYNKSILTK
ncbi:MAG TPA: hypothetical protein VFU15_08085 [Bacteroidia bacterium]|nr:hypothetical protein [Bacteroidia bacterium]